MWPFKKQPKAEDTPEISESLKAAILQNAMATTKNRMALEHFLLIHNSMPAERKDDPELDYGILGAWAVACIANQVFRLQKVDYRTLPQDELIVNFALMVVMADIVSQKTGGHFELTAHLAHAHFMSAFFNGERMFEGVEHLDSAEYAGLFSRKACDLHQGFVSTDEGSKVATECALATWRWISAHDTEALSALCDLLGPRARKRSAEKNVQ